MSKVNTAYKYRLYPDESQRILLAKTFGCCRKIWNLMLADKKDFLSSDGIMLYTTPAMYKADKRYSFLKEVDSLALANVQLDLEQAFRMAFSHPQIGFPKFKSKHNGVNSYTTNCQTPKNKKGKPCNPTVYISDKMIHLPKVGDVKAVIHRKAPNSYKLKSVTVSQSRDGSYYASVLYEHKLFVDVPSISNNSSHIGLDYKSDGLFVSSDGKCCEMPHYYRASSAKLSKMQRKLSHMIESHITGYTKGSKGGRIPVYDKPLDECRNILKMRRKIAGLSAHIANQRKDFLQKKSSEITNQFDVVSVEDLNLKAISNKDFGNGKATLDNGYGMFLNMLSYKQERKGHMLIKVDRFYPSSQLCSHCGYKNPRVKDLHIRKWTCPCCGAFHDRDENAAINIDTEGFRIALES